MSGRANKTETAIDDTRRRARERDAIAPMLPEVAPEYATPPEDADRNTPEPDWLAKAARQHEEGWTSGYVEGAVGELDSIRIGLAPLADRLGVREYIEARLAELRRRFGDADVDRQLQRVPALVRALDR
jgi:hypothetical protein